MLKKNWNIDNWKDTSTTHYKCKDLKIKGTNIALGHVYQDYRDRNRTILTARLSNIKSKTQIIIDKHIDSITDTELTNAWELAFQEIEDKLFN